MSKVTYKPIDDAEKVASIIGEGLHTGLRKGTDAPEAHHLWEAVSKSDEAWSDALAYLVSGLDYMGLALCEKVEPFQCPAKMYHGPGHQSSTRCERTDGHGLEDEHYANNPMAPSFGWNGAEAFDRW